MTMDLSHFHTITPSAGAATMNTRVTSTLDSSDYTDVKPLGGGRQQQPPKGFLAFANGTPNWGYHNNNNNNIPVFPAPPSANAGNAPPPPLKETASAPVVVSYKECLRNHAANIGGHALDGCCEFMPSPSFTPLDPTSLKCAACGCHRNFHRRDPDDPNPIHHHHHHALFPSLPSLSLPPLPREPSPSPPPPMPLQRPQEQQNTANNSSAYLSSALLALSQSPRSGGTAADDEHPTAAVTGSGTGGPINYSSGGNSRKRFRTKFSQEQKEKMCEFSEKVGWRLNKNDEGLIEEFCNEVGVGRTVLKVWMHNNKNTFGSKRENCAGIGNGNGLFGGNSALGNGNGSLHSSKENGVKKVGACDVGVGNNINGHHHQPKHHDDQESGEENEEGNCENLRGVSSNESGSSSSG